MAQPVGSTENVRTCRENRGPRKASRLKERIWTIEPDRLIFSLRKTPRHSGDQMREPNLLDVVRLSVDLPEAGLAIGNVGTIVEDFALPVVAFEVEFIGEDASEKAICTLRSRQFVIAGDERASAMSAMASRKAWRSRPFTKETE